MANTNASSGAGARDRAPGRAQSSCPAAALRRLSHALQPEALAAPEYPAHLEVRRISSDGTFRLHTHQPCLSQTPHREDIGLEEVTEGSGTSCTPAHCLGCSTSNRYRSLRCSHTHIGVKDVIGLVSIRCPSVLLGIHRRFIAQL